MQKIKNMIPHVTASFTLESLNRISIASMPEHSTIKVFILSPLSIVNVSRPKTNDKLMRRALRFSAYASIFRSVSATVLAAMTKKQARPNFAR